MFKVTSLALALLCMTMSPHLADTRVSLSSCSISCDDNEYQAREILGSGAVAQGRPGKLGPVGPKGDLGVKGDRGIQGPPGEACDCSRYDELHTQVATLQAEMASLKGRVRLAPEGWTRVSDQLFYKLFNNETVDYETAKSRCAVLNARLVATGMRNPKMRREMKRLLPPNQRQHMWIGLDDLTSKGNYMWSDGVKSTSNNTDWNFNQPDLSHEHCAGLAGTHGKVFDTVCSRTYNYLCEMVQ